MRKPTHTSLRVHTILSLLVSVIVRIKVSIAVVQYNGSESSFAFIRCWYFSVYFLLLFGRTEYIHSLLVSFEKSLALTALRRADRFLSLERATMAIGSVEAIEYYLGVAI